MVNIIAFEQEVHLEEMMIVPGQVYQKQEDVPQASQYFV